VVAAGLGASAVVWLWWGARIEASTGEVAPRGGNRRGGSGSISVRMALKDQLALKDKDLKLKLQ
jgi:hypothetical protein